MPSMSEEHRFIHTAAELHAPNKSPTAVLLARPTCGPMFHICPWCPGCSKGDPLHVRARRVLVWGL